jgi:hypothetical protein
MIHLKLKSARNTTGYTAYGTRYTAGGHNICCYVSSRVPCTVNHIPCTGYPMHRIVYNKLIYMKLSGGGGKHCFSTHEVQSIFRYVA